MRGWFEAADAAGLGAELIQVLGESRILVRGPKARGASARLVSTTTG